MALRYPSEWKFAGADEIPAVPPELAGYFYRLLTEIADTAENAWSQIERFKRRFGAANQSSDHGWAETDLLNAVNARAANSVNFIESLWSALEDARARDLKTPSVKQVNARLLEYGVPFQIKDDELVAVQADAAIAATHVEGSSHGMPYELGDVIGQGGFGTVYRATRRTSVATFEYALRISPIAITETGAWRSPKPVIAIGAERRCSVLLDRSLLLSAGRTL